MLMYSNILELLYLSMPQDNQIKEMPAIEVFETENLSEIFEQIGSDLARVCKVETKYQPILHMMKRTFADLHRKNNSKNTGKKNVMIDLLPS